MLSKLRYLTHQSAVRGSRNLLDKAASDLGSLSKVCCICDTVHARNTHFEEKLESRHSKKVVKETPCLLEVDGNETVDYSLRALLEEVCILRDSSDGKQNRVNTRSSLVTKLERTRLLEIQPISNVIQKQCLSTTSRLLPTQGTRRRSHTDTSMGWLAGLKHLMYGEQEPKAACAEVQSTPAEASLSYLLWGCDTIQDVLNLVEPRIERHELDIDQYVEILQKLQMIIYKDLGQKYAWLAEDIIPGVFVYLLLNDVTVAEFKYLEQASAFKKLQENLIGMLDQMTVAQFTACLSGFVWLGVPATSSTISTFVAKLQDFHDEDFSVLCLHILSVCMISFERPELLVTKYVYPRLKALMKNNPEIPNDKKTLFSLMFLGHVQMPDVSVGVWLTKQTLQIVEESDHLRDPFLAGMAMKFCKDMRKYENEFNPTSMFRNMALDPESDSLTEGLDELSELNQKLLDIVIINLMDIYNILSCSDVARVAHAAHKLGIYGMPWGDFIRKRSIDMILEGNLPVGQLSQALSGLKEYRDMDRNLRDRVEAIILDIIDTADVTSTSYILDYLFFQGTNNHQLLMACQRNIIKLFDNFVNYRILSKRMFKFLAKFPMENEKDNMELQTKLIDVENIHFQNDMILRYLTSQETWLPTSPALLNILTQHLGWCSFKDFFRLVVSAGNWVNFTKKLLGNGQLDGETFAAVTNFEINIGKRYFRALEASDRLSDVLYMSYRVGLFNPKILCMKTLMRVVEKYTDSAPLDEERFAILTKILDVKQGYVSPKMFGRLLDSFASMKQERHIIANNMLDIMCKWFCSESDTVTEPFKDKVHEVVQANMDVYTRLEYPPAKIRMMENLCALGIFPKEALVDLLNVDTLARLDKFIDDMGDPGFKRRAYQRILNINRCIVIDAPEVGIPWFMETYVDECRLEDTDSNYQRRRQLNKMMCVALGEENLAFQKPLEYGYTASFLCLMNKDNKLIKYSENNFRFAKELEIQRVVIEFVFSDQTQANSLINLKLRREHLKKLGYKLIEIHDWELQSIALSKRADRIDYIKYKILGQYHRPVDPPTYKVLEEDELGAQNLGIVKMAAL